MRLRDWNIDDAENLLKIYCSAPDLERQMPSLRTVAEAQSFLVSNYLPAANHAVWCVEYAGQPAGCIAVNFTARDDAGAWDRGWVSYWSAPQIRGRGIMKGAVRAVCDWALGEAETIHTELDCSTLRASDAPSVRRLELGYRVNNPASGVIARHAGFTVEGVEREKFLYAGKTYDAVIAARLRGEKSSVITKNSGDSFRPTVHHVELWTADFSTSEPAWSWLMETLNAITFQRWHQGISWQGKDGSYVVLEQSPDAQGILNRKSPGMNHLALSAESREVVDHLRAQAFEHGWIELFAQKFPHAGGEEHYALYLEDAEGFEVEIVAKW